MVGRRKYIFVCQGTLITVPLRLILHLHGEAIPINSRYQRSHPVTSGYLAPSLTIFFLPDRPKSTVSSDILHLFLRHERTGTSLRVMLANVSSSVYLYLSSSFFPTHTFVLWPESTLLYVAYMYSTAQCVPFHVHRPESGSPGRVSRMDCTVVLHHARPHVRRLCLWITHLFADEAHEAGIYWPGV